MRDSRGFTLIELVVVVGIVGVLATVAIPMYGGTTERANTTEADAALGTIRTAMRLYYAEHGTYENASFTDGAQVTNAGILKITDFGLLGRCFSSECYTFDGDPTAVGFRIRCDGANSTAPNASEVAGVVRTINQDGDLL
jgi:prepilin-type N-terminal cleavage/methylation domain-containing protein